MARSFAEPASGSASALTGESRLRRPVPRGWWRRGSRRPHRVELLLLVRTKNGPNVLMGPVENLAYLSVSALDERAEPSLLLRVQVEIAREPLNHHSAGVRPMHEEGTMAPDRSDQHHGESGSENDPQGKQSRHGEGRSRRAGASGGSRRFSHRFALRRARLRAGRPRERRCSPHRGSPHRYWKAAFRRCAREEGRAARARR